MGLSLWRRNPTNHTRKKIWLIHLFYIPLAIIMPLVKRHVAKTISYRIISTLIGFLIMWWISDSIKVGAAFGVAELIYKPLQYYIHERVWYKWIKYGLKK